MSKDGRDGHNNHDRLIHFSAEFGQKFLITVDVEEEFDWAAPLHREKHRLDHVDAVLDFQKICDKYHAKPVYLVDWPIINNDRACEIYRHLAKSGQAEIGIQLHPWVTPPFDEEISIKNSFCNNLPLALQKAKLQNSVDKMISALDVQPRIFRSGRYGFAPKMAEILKEYGIVFDTSVRPYYDYSPESGPDFSQADVRPYWLDQEKTIAELPLTTSYWGVLRTLGRGLYPAIKSMPWLEGILAQTSLLDRISLTPEGVTISEAIRAIDIAIDDGLPLMILSFHSPSLRAGNTPYANNQSDVDRLLLWWDQILGYLGNRNITSTNLDDILANIKR